MKRKNESILHWVIEKIRNEYPDDVGLLIVYGSYITGNDGPLSDIDFYFVPNKESSLSLGRTFIIEGIGYDLFPLSWERLEGLASLNENLTPLLGNARIAWCQSEKDKKRFIVLRRKLADNLSDDSFMEQKTEDKLKHACDLQIKLANSNSLCDCRLLAGGVLLDLADAVAYKNRTYFHRGLKEQYTDLKRMENLPDGFIEKYEAVIRSNTIIEIKRNCMTLIMSTINCFSVNTERDNTSFRDSPSLPKTNGDPDYLMLAELYGEIVSTFNKVYFCCENNNPILAFLSTVCLQNVLNEEVGALRFDLLECFDMLDLSGLFKAAKAAESKLIRFISEGASIKRYKNVDEFLRDNPIKQKKHT
ncbi:MAG: nucleotidyltransferase domain-containing protein [Clostridiales bacterium]|nr:nucleotidyltransferase domain-containing protein [Clostridiales bacterium]